MKKSTSELIKLWAGDKVESEENLRQELEVIGNLGSELFNIHIVLKTILMVAMRSGNFNEQEEENLEEFLRHIECRIEYYQKLESIDAVNVLPI